mmetsp:Transcript_26074/g.59057  ORF Transcript_26074/g.59057 Transcript_26074/m.59057 type:complete len:211 (-) Transcript_26074:220-852(-)
MGCPSCCCPMQQPYGPCIIPARGGKVSPVPKPQVPACSCCPWTGKGTMPGSEGKEGARSSACMYPELKGVCSPRSSSLSRFFSPFLSRGLLSRTPLGLPLPLCTRGLPSPCSASWLCLCVSDASSLASSCEDECSLPSSVNPSSSPCLQISSIVSSDASDTSRSFSSLAVSSFSAPFLSWSLKNDSIIAGIQTLATGRRSDIATCLRGGR